MDAPREVELAVADRCETLHQSPQCFGLPRSRWWLSGLRQVVPWMGSLSLAGVWGVLDRFDLAYKRGRRSVHSPDPDYQLKAARLRVAWSLALADPQRYVLLSQDEVTYYRCPTVAQDYQQRASKRPCAEQGSGYNSGRRIAACLDAFSGRLLWWQRSAFDQHTFLRSLLALQEAYPQAEEIFIALDNWPTHVAEEVRAGLFASRITLVFLPTSAPWLNPIEKVWRKLKQEVLHLHRYQAQWKELQERVEAWLLQYDRPAPDLLHYVGLLPD